MMRNDPIVEEMRAPFGLLATDLEFQRARTLYAEAGTLADGSRLAEVLADLEAEIEADFSREAGTASLTFEVWADMRYEGQSFDLPVTAPAGLAPAGPWSSPWWSASRPSTRAPTATAPGTNAW